MRGVRMSVEAKNDVHISLSSTNPITTNSWEIVLGGWSGKKSVIRRTHQGENLVTVDHSNEKFLEWQKDFILKMDESTVGLFTPDGEEIISYSEFDGSDVQYLYVSTGFSATGKWIVNKQQDGFDYDKDPNDALVKVNGRFDTFVQENFESHPGFVKAVIKSAKKTTDRMVAKFDKLNGKCSLFERTVDQEDDLRYDQNDPCKAAKQLPKAFVKWASVYNTNCNGNDNADAFVKRVESAFSKIEGKLTKKLKKCDL